MFDPKKLTSEEREEKSQDLVAAIRSDPQRFLDLYQLWLDPIYFYFLRLTQHKECAEDLTADFFLKLINILSKYKAKGKFSSWLFKVAHNLAMDHLRRENHSNTDQPLYGNESKAWIGGGTLDRDEIILLKQAIQTLSIEEQELLHLRFMEDLSFAEVASIVRKSEQSVKKAVYRILKNLNIYLGVDHE